MRQEMTAAGNLNFQLAHEAFLFNFFVYLVQVSAWHGIC